MHVKHILLKSKFLSSLIIHVIFYSFQVEFNLLIECWDRQNAKMAHNDPQSYIIPSP